MSTIADGFRNVGAGERSGDTYSFTETIEVANLTGGEQFLLLVVNDGSGQIEADDFDPLDDILGLLA